MPTRAASKQTAPTLQVTHTSQLPKAALDAAHALLRDVFAADLDEHDWEHALGGVHALLWQAERLLAHGSVVQRRLLHDGHALRAGYVEAVAVSAEHRRRGHGGAIMSALEQVIAGAYEVGALGATEAGARLYLSRGWKRWRGPTSALTPNGIVRTPEEDGNIYVFARGAELDLDGALACDWRDGSLW
ncbi:MAG: GNAT family N-acetyltransferase [Solirubrobacteraceae bacterium]